MSEDIIRYGAGGVIYRESAPKPKKKKAEPKPEVTVKLVNEEETSEADLAKLGLTNDENV